MNYEKMSDFEINQAVTCEVYGCHEWSVNQEGTFYHCSPDGSGFFIQKVADYCNNPSDAWPIMEKYGIATIVENGIVVGATSNSQEFYEPFGSVVHSHLNTNALRAAMIVFLMMHEESK